VLASFAAAPALAQEAPLPDAPPVAVASITPGTPAVGFTYDPAPVPAFGVPIVVFDAPPAYQRDAPQPEAPKKGDTHFDLGFGTEAPISVGGVATLEVPGRILFQLGVGFMPHGYVNAVDGFLTAVKAYDANVSGLVRSSLGNSFVLRASGGWRPFPNAGLEIMGGYTLMTMGGSATAADLINAVLIESGSGQRVPQGGALAAEIPLAATLHNVHVSLGWRWLLADDHLVIRASVSYLQTLASNVSVDLSNTQASAQQVAVNDALNAFVGPYFTKYAKAPTLGLSAAYRF
jgi:hypothetical protein